MNTERRVPEAYAIDAEGAKTRIDAESIEIHLADDKHVRIELGDCVSNDALVLTTFDWTPGKIECVPRFVLYPETPGMLTVRVIKLPVSE